MTDLPQWMLDRGTADVAAVFAHGLSGDGVKPLLTDVQLLELSDLCLAHDRIVHTIEAYEVTDDAQYLVSEFSLFGQDAREDLRPWPDRARDSHKIVLNLVAASRAAEGTFMFQVWLDWPGR
jgi:hypothetical protein